MFFDPRYLLFVMLPTMALAFFAQWWVKSAFNQASQIPNSRRLNRRTGRTPDPKLGRSC